MNKRHKQKQKETMMMKVTRVTKRGPVENRKERERGKTHEHKKIRRINKIIN